ncbi:hypothetical protein H6B14_02110 [Phocaeicola coprophilus]|nr:hypothetical protein [Phocaeicola coprophilus]
MRRYVSIHSEMYIGVCWDVHPRMLGCTSKNAEMYIGEQTDTYLSATECLSCGNTTKAQKEEA